MLRIDLSRRTVLVTPSRLRPDGLDKIALMPQLALTSMPIHGEYRKRGDKID